MYWRPWEERFLKGSTTLEESSLYKCKLIWKENERMLLKGFPTQKQSSKIVFSQAHSLWGAQRHRGRGARLYLKLMAEFSSAICILLVLKSCKNSRITAMEPRFQKATEGGRGLYGRVGCSTRQPWEALNCKDEAHIAVETPGCCRSGTRKCAVGSGTCYMGFNLYYIDLNYKVIWTQLFPPKALDVWHRAVGLGVYPAGVPFCLLLIFSCSSSILLFVNETVNSVPLYVGSM